MHVARLSTYETAYNNKTYLFLVGHCFKLSGERNIKNKNILLKLMKFNKTNDEIFYDSKLLNYVVIFFKERCQIIQLLVFFYF